MKIVLLDTETTGLLLPEGSPLENQPRIIEFAGIKVDENLQEIDRMEFMCHPEMPLPPIITKITGITDLDLAGKYPFCEYGYDLMAFIEDCDIIIAHNVNYDLGMLRNEFARTPYITGDGKEKTFIDTVDFPKRNICTVEATYHIKNRRMKLSEVYEHFMKKKPAKAHRAIDDVETLLELVKKLVEEGIICLSISSAAPSTVLSVPTAPLKKSSPPVATVHVLV